MARAGFPQDARVESERLVADLLSGELPHGAFPPGGAHAGAKFGILDQSAKRPSQSFRVLKRNEKPLDLVRHGVAATRDVCGHDGPPGGQGFEERHREPFPVGRKAHDMAGAQKPGHIADPSWPFDGPFFHPSFHLGFGNGQWISGIGAAGQDESRAYAFPAQSSCRFDELEDPLRPQEAGRKNDGGESLRRRLGRETLDIHPGAGDDESPFGYGEPPTFEFLAICGVLEEEVNAFPPEDRSNGPESGVTDGPEERPVVIEEVSESRNGVEDGGGSGGGGGQGAVEDGLEGQVVNDMRPEIPIQGHERPEAGGFLEGFHPPTRERHPMDRRPQTFKSGFSVRLGKGKVDVVSLGGGSPDERRAVDAHVPADDVREQHPQLDSHTSNMS